MKVMILIAAAFFPLLTLGIFAAMIYAKRGQSRHSNGIRELIVVFAVVAFVLMTLSILFVVSALWPQ